MRPKDGTVINSNLAVTNGGYIEVRGVKKPLTNGEWLEMYFLNIIHSLFATLHAPRSHTIFSWGLVQTTAVSAGRASDPIWNALLLARPLVTWHALLEALAMSQRLSRAFARIAFPFHVPSPPIFWLSAGQSAVGDKSNVKIVFDFTPPFATAPVMNRYVPGTAFIKYRFILDQAFVTTLSRGSCLGNSLDCVYFDRYD
jgi:hypothetical protein